MKYLKYLLIAILVLVLLFFLRGLMTPSITYENEVTVNKSAKESWAVMSDISKLPEWIQGLKKVELVSGTEGQVGAVSKIYVEDQGQEMVMEETIMKSIDNELQAMKFTMDFMDMDYEMALTESNGKTTLNTKSTTSGNGLFAKSMISFMKGAMTKQEDVNLQNLKKLIDENTTDYFPEPEVVETADEM